ncbi:MAG: DUF4097 domain-containing protein [Clostridiales bacterium]|nr:DUF4097 domain-containing protein [Clostridiales bacterium]
MNQTVKRIVDILFQDVAESEETNALHEELMNNCQEHYQDMIDRGLSEDEAVGEVVESLKGMKDVIAQYPKKAGAPAGTKEEDEMKAWVFAGMDKLKVETEDQDIFVGPSVDGDIHVYCDDPEGLKTETSGSELRITGVKKTQKAASAFEMPEGEEISLSGLLNMVGKAIRNVTTSFVAGAAIRVEVPDGQMKAIELNSRSGDIECTCAMARKMTVRTTSGDVSLEPVTEKTAETLLASTVSGDAEIHGSALDAEISSMSGDVTADGVFENLRMKSTSGDVHFTGSVIDLTMSTISGDAGAEIENNSLKHAEGKSTSGDVNINLPDNLNSVHAEISSVSGDCLSRVSDAGSAAAVQIRAKSISGDVTVE